MSWPCERPSISRICLKHIDFWDRKGVTGREGPTEAGQHCSQPTSFFYFETHAQCTCISSPHPDSLPGGPRRTGCTCTNNMAQQVQLHKRCAPAYLRKEVNLSLLLSFSSLSLSHSLCSPQIWTIHASGPTWDLRTSDFFSSLPLFYAFFSLLSCFIFTKWGYHILLLTLYEVSCEVWGLVGDMKNSTSGCDIGPNLYLCIHA